MMRVVLTNLKNMKKVIIGIIVLIILITAGYLIYPMYSNNAEEKSEIDDWKIYNNEKHGYSFKYPVKGEITLEEADRILIQLKTEDGEYGEVLEVKVSQCDSGFINDLGTIRLGEFDFTKDLDWGRAALNSLAKSITYATEKDGRCFSFMFTFIYEEESWHKEWPSNEEAMDVESWDEIVSTFK